MSRAKESGRCVDDTEQTVTVTFLSNHEVPVKDLDLESDDEELVEQVMSNAKPRGHIQEVAESEQSLASRLRRIVDDDLRTDGKSTDTDRCGGGGGAQ